VLRANVKIKLLIFVLITVVGVGYVGAEYVGLGPQLFGSHACTVSADFADSGGIFTNAEVDYRGVAVGRVSSLHLVDQGTENGVRVNLHIGNCASAKIPASAAAQVSDLSVIGEQYVNLLPANDNGPYLHGGEVIPLRRDSIPVSPETLLTNLDMLVKSVDTQNLQTVVSELGQAFNGQGQALGTLLDSANTLLTAAQANITPTLDLIKSAEPVLSTQLAEGGQFASFTTSLDLLSKQLKASNPDLENLLDDGPAELDVLQSFVQDNRTDLGVTLANLAGTGQLIVRHIAGVEQILELYPALAAGGESVLRPTGSAGVVGRLGLVLNNNPDPQVCGAPGGSRQGYGSTTTRPPSDTSPAAPNVGAQCTAPASSGIDVRGSQNVPGGDPVSTSGGGVTYSSATTTAPVNIGTTSSNALVLGDDSWAAMLTNGLN